MSEENKAEEQLSVLIVDDDADIRSIVASAVTMKGFTPIEAESGLEALKLCEQRLPDMAVLDIMMPEMDGNELCQRLRKMEGGEIIPIIMLTARDGLQDKVESLTGGADDYLTKPFHYQELQARLQALLRVRELNLRLQEKNQQLEAMQAKLIEQERQLVTQQLAGTAAHQLGQPLSALMLNVHLIESLDREDEKYKKALAAVKLDTKRMAELIDKLKTADAGSTEEYHGKVQILKLEE